MSEVKPIRMFYSKEQLRYAILNGDTDDISRWDVSRINDMSWLFENSKFKGDISGWDVGNVEDMRGMFYRSQFNGDISKWDVSNVIDIMDMFGDVTPEKEKAAIRIQSQWRKCRYNPEYKMCSIVQHNNMLELGQ